MVEEERFQSQLGRIMRSRREQIGLTQDQVAAALSLSRTSIVNIEKGRQRVTAFQLVRLVNILRCELVELLPPNAPPPEDEVRQLLLGQRPSVVDWVTSHVSGAREDPK